MHHEVDGVWEICKPQSSRIPLLLDLGCEFPLWDLGGVASRNDIGQRKGYHYDYDDESQSLGRGREKEELRRGNMLARGKP